MKYFSSSSNYKHATKQSINYQCVFRIQAFSMSIQTFTFDGGACFKIKPCNDRLIDTRTEN